MGKSNIKKLVEHMDIYKMWNAFMKFTVLSNTAIDGRVLRSATYDVDAYLHSLYTDRM